MSTWQDSLLEAMTEYVQRQHGPDSLAVKECGYKAVPADVTVIEYEDTSSWMGGCETCDYYNTEVTFTLSDGSTQYYFGSFADLINELG